jgi:hypothetical protein
MTDTELEARIGRELDRAFGSAEPDEALLARCRALLERPDLTSSGTGSGLAGSLPRPDVGRAGVRSRRVWLPVAATAAIIAIATGIGIGVNGFHGGPPATTPTGAASLATTAVTSTASSMTSAPTPLQAAPNVDPVTVCDRPDSTIARFWWITAEPSPGVYQGTVTVGAATLPALAIYTSGGPPGIGILCVTDVARDPSWPIRDFTTASSRPIAYLAADDSGIPYLAVQPEVATVTLDTAGSSARYTTAGTAERQLQELGNGWHVLTLGVGYGTGTLTVRALNSSGAVIDTRSLRIP